MVSVITHFAGHFAHLLWLSPGLQKAASGAPMASGLGGAQSPWRLAADFLASFLKQKGHLLRGFTHETLGDFPLRFLG